MIYVFAPTVSEATRFVVDAYLRGNEVQVFTQNSASVDGLWFNEEDEVYYFADSTPQMNRILRKRSEIPHICKEVRYERAEAR